MGVNKFSGPIYETDMYRIEIRFEPDNKYEVYGIVNKKYGVCEAYISSLPRAIQMCDQLEYDLKHGSGAQEQAKAREFLASLAEGPSLPGEASITSDLMSLTPPKRKGN